jgi:periplasmic divalent cation tolerance protein
MMATDVALVLTTCGDAENAQVIARDLVEKRLAACVQIFPIESVFRWGGKVQTEPEVMLFCKIRRADYADVEAAIHAAHTYDVPEIIAIPIEAGSASYLAWVMAETGRIG